MSQPVGALLPSFWRDKRVLLTGHTGFKGSWLSQWLEQLGARVTGISLPPNSEPNLFTLANVAGRVDSHLVDIRDAAAVAGIVRDARPQVAFHLAAQALVRPGYRDPLGTFATNVQGTANVLEALRGAEDLRAVVVITTDKVYRNLEQPAYAYQESDPLGGYDPYSASKAAAEMVVSCYRDSFLSARGVSVASARAGNVIGGGDWSEDRLIPDAVRAWSTGRPLQIRRPEATRPWQHVLEPLLGYLLLAQRLWDEPGLSGAFNFGPEVSDTATVRRVIEIARSVYGKGDCEFFEQPTGPHEAGWLALSIDKARSTLQLNPRWNLEGAITRTMQWYRGQADGVAAAELCAADIAAFGKSAVAAQARR